MRQRPNGWEAGGLLTEEGNLERPLAPDEWLVPDVIDVDTERERLIWSPLRGHAARRSGSGLLEDFVALAEAPATKVRDYARRWGVLYLCEHGRPYTHNPTRALGLRRWPEPAEPVWDAKRRVFQSSERMVVDGCHFLPVQPEGEWWRSDTFWEPLEEWRRYARAAGALLNLAAELHADEPDKPGKPGTPEDWRAVAGWWGDQSPEWFQPLDAKRDCVARLVSEWLKIAGVRFALRWSRPVMWWTKTTLSFGWSPEAPAIVPESGGLFGAIGIQLMLAIGRSDGLAVCSACGRGYSPPRTPRANERRYCSKCRELGKPLRDARRATDRRKAEARRLAAEGLTAHDIAERVGSKPGTVRGWIAGVKGR